MDVERGNIEILFKKMNYLDVSGQVDSGGLAVETEHTYRKINRELYMRYAKSVFVNMTDNERDNSYHLACEQMKDAQGNNPCVFRLLIKVSQRLLRMDGNEIKCKFDQMFRWREISFLMGQDIFTCAYLAVYDAGRGFETKCFSWLPTIRSDNDRLHNILEKGIADNHFHLAGSTRIFDLNWISLMNRIDNRIHDFKKINRTLQEYYADPIYGLEKREDFYAECQRGALYRVYLFSVMKEDKFLEEKLGDLLGRLKRGARPEELVTDIQDAVVLTKNIYGARYGENVLDYALERNMIDENANECRLLAGERKFLYECFKYVMSDLFTGEQKNMFYSYLIIKTDFRGELVQTNRQVGFANFANYQDRKEYFIEGKKPYEDELVRLALNESLRKKNMVSLEARICPKNNSSELLQTLKNYERIVKGESKRDGELVDEAGRTLYSKLIYVMHFPKFKDQKFVSGVPRNDNVRQKYEHQAKSIVALLERQIKINEHIKGIDACASELDCRPEAFGQIFRYLLDAVVVCDKDWRETRLAENRTTNLNATYHAGEDFYDIVDGIRAIDEAILFCGLKRGSRLGHALALGIMPEEYYHLKGGNLVLPKQVLMDDIAWLICKASEYGCQIESSLKTKLEERFYGLYDEIFGCSMGEECFISVFDYYQSWKLRGDNPKPYRLNMDAFKKKMLDVELERFDRYQFNDRISNNLRKNVKYKELYFIYHYNKQVREKGNEIAEFKAGEKYANLVRQIQDHMIRQLVQEGIGIETNPSSNYLIGTIKKYEEHPIVRFNARKLKTVEPNTSLSVSINTDDQGVFDTLLENEYALMTLALKKIKDSDLVSRYDTEDIYEWVDYVRKMGLEQIFI